MRDLSPSHVTPIESAAVALAALVLAFALTAPALDLIPARDAGIFLYAAQTILDGDVLYRDAFDQKPPLIHFTFALGLLLSGGAAWGPWLLELLSIALAGWLSVRLFQPMHGRAVAWSPALSRYGILPARPSSTAAG